MTVDEFLQNTPWHSAEFPEGQAVFVFTSLRSQLDGEHLDDMRVRLVLDGVRAVALAYDTDRLEQRPSQLRVPSHADVPGLAALPLPLQQADVAIDSPDAAEDLRVAAEVRWLMGSSALLDEAPHRFVIRFSHGRLVFMTRTPPACGLRRRAPRR